MFKVILSLLISLFGSSGAFFRRLLRSNPQPAPSECLVVITGCDSGFGQSTSRLLSEKGYKIKCDVTKPEDILKVVKAVDSSPLKLWALVNNAGIAPIGFIDWLPIDSFRAAMEVNYFGLVQMTKSMLPFLKANKGSRVINISSMAGLIANEGFGPYAASKHAVEGFSKSLREEMRPWGVYVSNINPAFMRTPLITKSIKEADEAFKSASPEIRGQYPDNVLEDSTRLILSVQEDPSKVVKTIAKVLMKPSPARNYYVGYQAAVLRIFMLLPPALIEFFQSILSSKKRFK